MLPSCANSAGQTLEPDRCDCTITVNSSQPPPVITVERNGSLAVFNTGSMTKGVAERPNALESGSTVQYGMVVGDELRVIMSDCDLDPAPDATRDDMVIIDLKDGTARVP